VLGEEHVRRVVERQPVFGLGEAVALAVEEQVLVVDPVLRHGGDDLLGLGLLQSPCSLSRRGLRSTT
jgi:hypothetical protein